MPTIGSVSGTFGHGRSPQNAPQPGFVVYPPIGRTTTWTFAANGAFGFDSNTITNAGNCFVITPTTTFIANVLMWGAGGGSGDMTTSYTGVNLAGAAGAVYGTITFQGGLPYTVFTGSPGAPAARNFSTGGGGGAATGIMFGNIFQATMTANLVLTGNLASGPYIAIASGGGGATSTWYVAGQRIAGAGGGQFAQIGTYSASSQSYAGLIRPFIGYPGATSGVNAQGTYFQSGLPDPVGRWFTGGMGGVGNEIGGGGAIGGPRESGGVGYVAADETDLHTVSGNYGIPALSDHGYRGLAGGSDVGGRMTIYLDEYQLSNITADGGTVTEVPIPGYELAYRYHTFTTSGTFTVNSASTTETIDIFAVGGGGGGLDGTGIYNSGGNYIGQSGAGGGGGGVVIRTKFPISAGTYNIEVGQGGAKSDSYALTGTGRTYGGYRGGDTAIYTNALSTKTFPNAYWRLLNSFGTPFKYISQSGDDTDGLTLNTAYTSFATALSKNAGQSERMVFAVIGGTYDAQTISGAVQTPINDGGKPRVFVCAPGKVNINFTPIQSNFRTDCPMAVLSHPLSAIYGATIIRNMYETTDVPSVAFFSSRATPGNALLFGSFYNCVFKENQGKWSLAHGATGVTCNFRAENCTFYTKDAAQVLNTGTNTAALTLIKDSIFNKLAPTDAVLDNCVTNQAVAGKYIVASITDKGVYSGPYSWSLPITTPVKTAKSVIIVAQGGGGGCGNNGPAADAKYPNHLGGSGGGNLDTYNMQSTQYNNKADYNYSAYGYQGGRQGGSGGGGAGYPGHGSEARPRGGVGIEWPRGSNTYYGTGGDSINESIIEVAAGTVGKGGNGSTTIASIAGAGLENGNDGIVAIRYVVPGPYTAVSETTANINLIAYGGVVTSTATYRQHVFNSSGLFTMINNPTGIIVEAIIVGGGGGGAGNYYYWDYAQGGAGGGVQYDTIPINDGGTTMAITVGGGGAGGRYYYSGRYFDGGDGGNSAIYNNEYQNSAYGGSGGRTDSYRSNPAPGKTITDGLFADNVNVYYSADAGQSYPSVSNGANWGGYGSGGRGAGGSWTNNGNSGLDGIVIIRYPIYPAN